MNPDPTLTISFDYIVELTDDGNEPEPADPDVIIIPPASHGMDPAPPFGNPPTHEPQL
jgi:hypothetical protein